MQIISDAEFRKQLKGELGTAYLFYGEEDYLKSHALSLAANTLCPDPSFALFNSLKLDMLDYSPEKLADMLMPLPMMADKKLITLTGFDFGAMRQSEVDELCDTLTMLDEYDYNTVIICVASGCIDEGYSMTKPSSIIRKLSEFIVPVRFEKSTPQKLATWALKHFEHGGVKIGTDALSFFIEYCGSGMYRLANEIDKLCAYVLYSGRDTVTKEDIREVTVADTEFDTFALAGAIMEGRNSDALSVLDFLRFKRTDPLLIFGEISKTICDLLLVKRLVDDGHTYVDIGKAKIMNEYKAKLYVASSAKLSYPRLYRKIELCTEADRILKTANLSDGYSAIEMLICSE
ncbi:MAG: DNA polymerase III subunit delta [Ruminococcaceae bacterium]|nr:DNA polymerase III subunit delta [Oscillospiraceae bacterium]